SRSLERRIQRSEELRRCVADYAELDDALRRTAPKPTPAVSGTEDEAVATETGFPAGRESKGFQSNPPLPATLHGSIMAGIRAAQPSHVSRPAWLAWQWLAPAGIAALVVAGAVWFPHRHVSQTGPGSVPPLATAFEGASLAPAIPTDLTAPLSDDRAHLNADLDRTGQFLLANLP